MEKPKILFISSFLLFPNTHTGGSKRLWYFANEIQKYADLYVIACDECKEIAALNNSPPSFKNFIYVNTERCFLSKIIFPFGFNLSPLIDKKKILKILNSNQFDCVIVAFPRALSLMRLKSLKKIKKFIYIEDDLIINVYKERFKKRKNLLKKIYNLYCYFAALSLYKKMIKRISNFICISQEEREYILKHWPNIKTTIISYGIPTEEYPLLPLPKEKNIGFIGNYFHPPNMDALNFILNEIFPFINTKEPEIKLVLAGRGLPKNIKEKYHNENIILMDEVFDLQEFYKKIAIFINPIRIQGGVRTKLIEVAAFGRPIISTRLGAEGLYELKIEFAENAQDFYERIKYLIKFKEEKLYDIINWNREAVEKNYCIENVTKKLVEIIKATTPA